MFIESDSCGTNHSQKEPKNSKMKTKSQTTATVTMRTVLRKYPDGQIIALFPDVPWSGRQGEITSYMHLGQHGAADYHHVVATTKPATKKESAGLLNELRQVGYNNIRVIKRIKIEKL